MFADSFNDGRILWLFPFLAFSRTNNITGWAFRVKPPSQQWRPTPENMPSFELWQESLATPALDYRCINCSVVVQSTEQYFEDSNSVYRQVLETPLVVAAEEQYILGIKIPPPGPENLHLAFQRLETPDRLSYFVGLDTSFINIRPQTYQDNLHVPLVSPIYGRCFITVHLQIIPTELWSTKICLRRTPRLHLLSLKGALQAL